MLDFTSTHAQNGDKTTFMKSMNKIVIGLLWLTLPTLCISQNFFEISLGAGGIVYYGDLTLPDVTFKQMHVGQQLSIKKYFHGEHALRFNMLHGTISGDDNNYKSHASRGNKFSAKLTEFAIMGEIDVRGKKRYTKKAGYNKTWSPYVMFGLSGIYCKPDVSYGQPDSKDLLVNYPDWHFGMPVGGGIKFDVNERILVGAEFGVHLTLSDYLDGTQASGNAYKNDAFFFSSLTVAYRLQSKKNVPKTVLDKA